LILSRIVAIVLRGEVMPESTQLGGQALPRAVGREDEGFPEHAWEKAKSVLTRSLFWSYERGTWQYDIIVLLILAFIFATPRSWFRDRPTLELTNLQHNQGVVEVSRGKDGRSYLIDARLVESFEPMKLEDAVRQILAKRLHKLPFVKSIDPVRSKNNVILGYTVVVSQ